MAELQLTNITKVYPGGNTAVRNFTLDIADREFVVIVGPSGCGKSTALRMIAGLEEITSGELYIGGRHVNEVPPKNRNIAMVFQSYALYPHMSVYKNMAFAMKMRHFKKTEIDVRVRETAELLGITHLLDRKPRALSGGESQRVALGRAMVRNPEVFLLDEPLSNLDAKLRADMRAELIRLHKRLETTFIYVTHDQTEAMTMGDRIVLMNNGEILQADTPKNLYDYPADTFVAGFIGSPRMNFAECIITERNGAFFATVGRHVVPLAGVNAPDDVLFAYAGRRVTLGIRPEHLYISPEQSAFAGTVDLAEALGAETNLYVDIPGGLRFIVREFDDAPYSRGQNVNVAVRPERVHLFSETGAAITGKSDGAT